MKLIHERVCDWALRNPEKPALIDERGEMTYRELDARSAQAAAALAARGAKPGDRAAVYVPYTKDILLGAVSVLRAGCVFVPFDDAYPVERLQYMLRDSEAAAILTLRELWEKKKPDFPAEKVIFLDEVCPGANAGAEAEPPAVGTAFVSPSLTPASPAMLLYTSGTTGNPKGVLHTHNMLLHLVDWIKVHPDAAMNADTRSGAMSSFSFVGTQMFLLGPLLHGGTVCIAPEAARKDLTLLGQFLREYRVTHMFLPSGLAAILAEDYDIRGRFLFAAGEKLRNFRPLCPGSFLINSYGSTELSGVLSKKVYGDEDNITVGKCWKNTRVRLADEKGNPPAPGEPGELLVSSSFMARRYYGLPELSREKWVRMDGRLWFRTGDRAVCNPEGDWVLLGRTDNMVKLRGFRIETGEVETQIARAARKLGRDDVTQPVVTVKTVCGTDHLCCYYEAEKELEKEAMTEEISRWLPEYMIPDTWVRMDALPRNANGKIMRSQLPQPVKRHKTSGVLDSEVLSRLVMTAEDVLEPAGFIGPDDRFTDLGGTSLTAMKFAAMLREQGIKISGAQVLQLNVLREIADAAEVSYEQLWSSEERAAVRADFASRGECIQKVLPLSPEQDEMLFMQILHPDRIRFWKTWFLQLDSPVSEEQFREALDFAAQEDEVLRAAVVYHDVSVVQQVITDRRIPLEMLTNDVFGSGEMGLLRSRISDEPADLQRESLIRAFGIRTKERNFLCVTAHSIALDDRRLRACLARVMGMLEKHWPDDVSIREWHALLQQGAEEERPTSSPVKTVPARKSTPPDIFVYSDIDRPKLVFVHTGNTGSEAYYRLADRIRDALSFSVIEPFNLYHTDEAVCGIRNIAANYIRILKRQQPNGPYLLGGWCYGGVVAHEMACQLEAAGEEVRHLFMLDSHALDSAQLRKMSEAMLSSANRNYFETSPLFAELRQSGMLEAVITNAAHVAEDLKNHRPSVFHGSVTYFKPDTIPAGVTGDNRRYWEKMMEFEAGNFEHYCCRDKLRIIHTPHEHDLMMDDPSLDIIVPEIINSCR